MMLNKVSLNTIGLNRIGLNRIGKPSRASSDRPYIDPEVLASLKAVCICYGKSNDDPDRAIVKNLVDPDNPFVISNASFKLNSGFGKYEEDFTSWIQTNGVIASSDKVQNSITGRFLYFNTVNKKEDVPSFKVNITLGQQSKLQYNYIKEDGTSTYIVYSESGIYTIPASYFSKYTGGNAWFGFYQIEGTSIIEQIPSFEGAFVTDGIDDLIKSTKSATEMLDGSNEVTVVSMIHQIKTNSDVTRNNWFFTPVSYLENRVVENKTGKTGIYGYTSTNVTNAQISDITPILGDKNDYTLYSKIEDGDRDYFTVEGFQNQGIWYVSSIAWYWTIIANKVLTTDQINQVIAYFNLDRTLNPDILCNIGKQGITNDNHADFNDKLVDYSGNGRDVQMNNLAWKGGSGIAAKPFETIKDYTIVSDEARQKLTIYNEFSYKIKSNTPSYYWTVQSIIRDNTSYQVTIITDKDCYWINATSFINSEGNKESIRKKYPVLANTPTQVIICGLDQFEYPEGIEPTNAVSYVNLEYAGEITITFIPSHKGGLLLDGVNDFGKVTGMPVYKDYTFIIDRQIISIGDTAGVVASKSENLSDATKHGAFIFEYLSAPDNVSTWSFYKNNAKVANTDFTRGISYQSKYSYNGKDLTVGTSKDSDKLWLGTIRDRDFRFFNGAIYSLMSFPYSMSKFLIERQLKKHKLGTLYPDMVEFRPVIKSNVLLDAKPTFVIRGTSTYLNAGDYVPENSQIWVSIKMNNAADRITKFTVNGKTIDIPENAYSEVTLQYGFPFVIDKSPQKITMTIEQDENYVKFEPVITSNVEYVRLDFYLNNYQKRINIGDYIPKDAYLRANLYLKNNVDELTVFTFNGVNIGYRRSSVDDTAFNIKQIYNYDSPQEVNITVDEYIRYEDIVQPYPVVFQIKDRNTNQIYSWGDKIKVGSSIQLTQGENPNLLNGLYSIRSYEYEGKAYSYNQLTNLNITVTKQSISLSCNKIWLLDNNEPKVILSPRLLRIPNSSYKILGHIPDISGHGNHGVIHNSAYAEGSGVNEDGSYQFDGVDDFITIPTTVGGKQVLMKVNWQSIAGTAILYDQRTNGGFAIFNRDFDTNENKVPAYRARNIGGSTYIDGILNKYIYASELKNITHNIVELHDPKLNIGTLNPKIGSSYLNSSYTQMSLYDFMLFDEISTDDKIKELNEYVGIEGDVWGILTQLSNSTLISNETLIKNE